MQYSKFRRSSYWSIISAIWFSLAVMSALALVPTAYDDGKTEAAVFRNGTWYLLNSTGGVSIQQFGLANDKPMPAAYVSP